MSIMNTPPAALQRKPIGRRIADFWQRRDFSEKVGLGALAVIVLGLLGAFIWYVEAPIDNSGVVARTSMWQNSITNVKVTRAHITIDTKLYPDAEAQGAALGICTEASSWAADHGGQDVEVNGQAGVRMARTGDEKFGDFKPCVRVNL